VDSQTPHVDEHFHGPMAARPDGPIKMFMYSYHAPWRVPMVYLLNDEVPIVVDGYCERTFFLAKS
jgi:hypothetical protein